MALVGAQTPRLDEKEWPEERIVKEGQKLYVTFYNGLRCVIPKREGPVVHGQVWGGVLTKHHRRFFLQGLQKLGIDPNKEPHAVACAKYHYFSNLPGGFDMKYFVESPKKAWINYGRYRGPHLTHGLHMFILSYEYERSIFAWHALNGESLGNPRLGFIITRLLAAGDPYMEGYFQEYDRDLYSEERLQYKPGEIGPDYDPSKFPKLDPKEWPPMRVIKSQRNYSREYIPDAIRALLDVVGLLRATQVVQETYWQVALHYADAWLAEFGIKDTNAKGIATLFKFMGDVMGDTMEFEQVNPQKFVVRQTSCKLLPERDLPKEIFDAMAAFYDMAPKVINPRVKVYYTKNMILDGVSEWTVEQTEKRWI
jgi:hypothetical protein